MTFEKYLKDYVEEMSDLPSDSSIEEYAKEAKHNFRLREILIYYSIVSDKSLVGTFLEKEYIEIFREIKNNEPLPREYMKIKKSYESFLKREG